jgi:hypothetical protein
MPGDVGDELEVAVVVEHGETASFGGRGDERIGQFAATESRRGKRTLKLALRRRVVLRMSLALPAG